MIYYGFLLLLLICESGLCMKDDDSVKCCIVNGNDPGIMIDDPVKRRDSHFAGIYSKYRNRNTAITIANLTSKRFLDWQVVSSYDDPLPLKALILDERWEKFEDNHESTPAEFESLLKRVEETPNIDFPLSIRLYSNAANTSLEINKWHHLLVKNKTVHICSNLTLDNLHFDNCQQELLLNMAFKEFVYTTSSYPLGIQWKFHKTKYLFIEKTISQQILNINKEVCTIIQKGCLVVHIAACKHCYVTLTPYTSVSNKHIITVNGTEMWSTVDITLTNLSDCFALWIEANVTDNIDGSEFWALDPVAHLTYQSCKKTKRYISVNSLEISSKNLTCENAFNENIDFISECSEKLEEMNMDPDTTTEETPIDATQINPLHLIIAAVVTLVIIVLLVLITFFFKRKPKVNIRSQIPGGDASMELLTTPEKSSPRVELKDWEPIKSGEFIKYVQQVFEPKEDNVQRQFSSLPGGYLKPSEVGRKTENMEKNRYPNIYPYDENRVILEKNLGDVTQTSDYINASYVMGFNNPKEYIVTQNPLKHTVLDFFRMIWQEKVEYIVMISSTSEKYYCYWPTVKKSAYFDGIEVTVLRIDSYEFFDHRVLLIHRYGETREINQLHFHAWSQEILSSHVFSEFINYLLKIPHNSAPIVFHCLAGVGRSATIILCDIALRSAAITGNYDLYNITKQLRECRVDMVPNLKQYQLAHLIIFESINYKDTSTEINNDFEANFSRLFEGNTIKKMWSVYLENTEWIYQAITPFTICYDYPKRNRYADNNLLPAQHSRVVLQYKQPNYVHAMFIDDFNQQKNIIVAQQPLRSTLSDFWIMVLQNHAPTIVNLNDIDFINRGDVHFFPTLEKTILKLQGNISIQFSSEEENLNYDKLVVEIYAGRKFEKKVEILNIKGWPKIEAVPESTDVMIRIWETTKGDNKTQNFPIVICCDDGVVSSGLVACFFYMAEKMLRQRKCDVVGAVRAVRRSHTNFINFDQFVFLHHCALAFYKICFKKHQIL